MRSAPLLGVASFTSAFAAVRTLPTPGPSGYVDRESSVVVAFPTNLGRQVAMTLAAPFAPTNAVEGGKGQIIDIGTPSKARQN